MSNMFDLEGSQDKEATATVPFEPMPTIHLHSRIQILEEEERHQRITRAVEEDQQQQLTIDENEPCHRPWHYGRKLILLNVVICSIANC
jgi:hypothetical protein